MYDNHFKSNTSRSDEENYSSDTVNSGWPPFGRQEVMSSVQESDLGRRNHLLATDVLSLSVMLLGNSQDTHQFSARTLQRIFFPYDSAEEEANEGEREEMVTLGQVTRNHQTQPPTFLSSRLRQPLVFQIEQVGEYGSVYQEGDGIIRWKFGIQELFPTDNTTVKIVSSPSVLVLNQPSEWTFFRLYLNSDGARYKAQSVGFFAMMTARSRFYNDRISVTLHNSHLRSIQLVIMRDCDISIGRSDSSVKAVCGCGDLIFVDMMKQSAKAGIVCLDIQFL